MTTKTKIGIAIGYTLVCVAVGRWAGPTKTVTVTQTVTVEAKKDSKVNDDETKKKTNQKTTTTTDHVEKPDGTKETKTTIVTEDEETTDSKKKDIDNSSDDTKTDSKTSKTVDRGGSKVNLSLLAGIDVKNPSGGFNYGGSLTKEVLGPFTLGLFVFTNGNAGVSVGISL